MVSKKTSGRVLKTEGVSLRDYEMVLIISPEVVDEEGETKIDSISRFITERGGSISSVEQLGKRRLAYPIEHFTEGNYALIKFQFKPALCKQLEASLQISEEVLRYLLIKSGD